MTTTIPTATKFDQQCATAIINLCETPNDIETGFTPTPINQLLIEHRDVYDYQDNVIALIDDRFPVHCTHIVKGLDALHYHFIISNARTDTGDAIFLHCDLTMNGFEIVIPQVRVASFTDAVNFAKGINAITEWAVEAA